METTYIVLLSIFAAFVVFSWLSVKRHEKHDRALFAFCDLRRELMAFLRERALAHIPPPPPLQQKQAASAQNMSLAEIEALLPSSLSMQTGALSAILPPAEMKASLTLLNGLNEIINSYNHHKAKMFNLREIKNAIQKDARKCQEIRRQVSAQLEALPKNSPVHGMYVKFGFIALNSLFVYTPFLRVEVITRLLLGGIAKQINAMREEWQKERQSRRQYA
jgi:hypothetical protein